MAAARASQLPCSALSLPLILAFSLIFLPSSLGVRQSPRLRAHVTLSGSASEPHQPERRELASCSTSLTTGSGASFTYTSCHSMRGSFALLWNATDTQDGNTSLSFAFQSKINVSNGWMAFGKSPNGKMQRGSVVMSIVRKGQYKVLPYYTGNNIFDLPHPGGYLRMSDLRGEFASGTMTTFATLSLPTANATACSYLIYATGRVSPRMKPLPHNERNKHSSIITYLGTGC